MDNGNLAIFVIPCLHECKGGMMRGSATAIWCIVRGGSTRRADARQRQHDKRQFNNQLAGGGSKTRSDVTTSQGEQEANGKQEVEAACGEAVVQQECCNER